MATQKPQLSVSQRLSEPTPRTVKNFIAENLGWSFNFLVSTLLFFLAGFPEADKVGYTDDLQTYKDNVENWKGEIRSGPSGSGVYPISLSLMLMCWCVYFSMAFHFFVITPKPGQG